MKEISKIFEYSVNTDFIAIITFDLPNEKANIFNTNVMKELQKLILELKSNSNIKGAVFLSGKKDIFIAGADIKEIINYKNVNLTIGKTLSKTGQDIFKEWNELAFPTCAIIDGACVGGGLEFALSCDFRIVSNNPKTILAFPEVKLGLLPGWGGTQRFTRIVGAYHAIDYISSGKNISANEAYEIGLVDDICNPNELIERALHLIKIEISTPTWQEKRSELSKPLQISDDQSLFTFGLARAYIYGETKGNYPAPMCVLDSIQEGYALSLSDALNIESDKFALLLGSEVSQNLLNIYIMNEELKKETGTNNKELTPCDIKSVGVIGSGIMGSGISAANIYKGIPCIMNDVNEDRISIGVNTTINLLNDRVKKGKITQSEMNYKLSILNPSTSYKSFYNADLLIEAVMEDFDVKNNVFKEVQKHVSESAILATNTSTISIDKLSENIKNKKNFIGLHFFNPVHKMSLVEVIRGKYTSDETVVTSVNYIKKLGKTPIVMNNGVGFLVNRILFPYITEATLLIESGNDIETIDKVMTRFGMPMGPIALIDLVGIDTAFKASEVLVNAFPERAIHSNILDVLCKNNRLGQKNGAGFYVYNKKNTKGLFDKTIYDIINKYIKKEKPLSKEEMLDRLILPMIVEATKILEDGIVTCVRDIDMSMILGSGFPPFRGGLLRYADSVGINNIINKCNQFIHLGERYKPTQFLLDMIKKGKKFYNA